VGIAGLASGAESDLIATMPRRFVAIRAAGFAVVSRKAPLRLRIFSIRAAVPKVALIAVAFILCSAPPHRAFATSTEPVTDPQVDPAPCVAAAAATDADKIIAVCGALIDNDKTLKADRMKALIARAGAYGRKDQIDRAIGDYDTVLRLDPTLSDGFNARGELWRKKGDRPRALADFGAAIKLNPDHLTAKGNYKSLAQELERLGALIAVHDKPSFNCGAARRAVEKAICANPELANLDREINAVHTRVVREAADSPRAGRALQREQDAFLARRNASFGRPDYDLRKAMKERLQHLLGVDGY
jgi:tetratricopeptide (TPR) repeat protein